MLRNQKFLFNFLTKFSFKNFSKTTKIHDPRDAFFKMSEHADEVHKLYGSKNKVFQHKAGNKQEFYAKKIRHSYLAEGAFNSQKHILKVKRLRRPDDTLAKLMKNNEVACVIEGREEIPDFDFVLDKRDVRLLDKKTHFEVKPYYITYNGEEYRCTLKKYHKHLRNFVYKVSFQRYIVGRPNLLTLPIEIIAMDKNHFLNHFDCDSSQNIEKIDLWCYNETYPPLIEIDARLIKPNVPFKIWDLERLLPKGMFLHRKYEKIRHFAIFTIAESWNQVIASANIGFEDNFIQNANEDAEDLENDPETMNDPVMKSVLEYRKKKENTTKYNLRSPFHKVSSKKIAALKAEGADEAAYVKSLNLKGKKKKIPFSINNFIPDNKDNSKSAPGKKVADKKKKKNEEEDE